MSDDVVLTIAGGELIPSPTTQYQVLKYLGSGTHGFVLQCKNVTTDEMAALKISKSPGIAGSYSEVAILKKLKALHSNRFNIVNLNEYFLFKGHFVLAFDHLDINLTELMKISPGQHLELRQIRPILQQLATSLQFLKGVGIVHGDLKPDNVMMVDHVRQPLRVKVIDFGLAINNPEAHIGSVIQSLWYRSPEILQEIPFTEAVDIWSLGCIIGELCMGRPLFPISEPTDLLNQILLMVGQPQSPGNSAQDYFWPRYLMEQRFMASCYGLSGVDVYAEQIDLAGFIDLLRKMLTLEPSERITPSGILEHPFMTMSYFGDPLTSSNYVKSSMDIMSSFPLEKYDEGGHGDQDIRPRSQNKAPTKRTVHPPKSKKTNKRDSSTSNTIPSRRRKVSLKKELSDILAEVTQPSSTQDSSTRRGTEIKRKRKRDTIPDEIERG